MEDFSAPNRLMRCRKHTDVLARRKATEGEKKCISQIELEITYSCRQNLSSAADEQPSTALHLVGAA